MTQSQIVILSGPLQPVEKRSKGAESGGKKMDQKVFDLFQENRHFGLGWDSTKRWGAVDFGIYYKCTTELI